LSGRPAPPVVILVRPQMPENVGSAARAMLNFGVYDLRLVAPDFGWPNAKAVAAATGAHAVMNGVTIHRSVAAAADDLHHLYATTSRPRDLRKPVMGPVAACEAIIGQMAAGRRAGLLFGPERTGLDNDEVALADAVLTVPLNPQFSSLNVAQAVLLCVYQWHACVSSAPPVALHEADRPATKGEVQAMLDHLLSELDDAGYFRSESRRKTLARTVTMMFERRQLSGPEVQLMRGIIKELRHGPFR